MVGLHLIQKTILKYVFDSGADNSDRDRISLYCLQMALSLLRPWIKEWEE